MGEIERKWDENPPATYQPPTVVEQLTTDCDSWRRVAERLEREKVDALEQLRGAVGALEEARALIETAEQDGYVSTGWREDAWAWASTLADRLGGQ